jgi:hypothetical protein
MLRLIARGVLSGLPVIRSLFGTPFDIFYPVPLWTLAEPRLKGAFQIAALAWRTQFPWSDCTTERYIKEAPRTAFLAQTRRFCSLAPTSDDRRLVLHPFGNDARARDIDLTYRAVFTVFPSNVAGKRDPCSGYFVLIIQPE